MKNNALKLCMLLILALVLAITSACSAKSENTAAGDAVAPVPATSAPGYAGDGGLDYAAGKPDANDNISQYGGYKIIRTFNISIETDEFDSDIEKMLNKVSELGGFSQSTYVNGRKPQAYNDPGRYASLVFRIPSDKVDEFVNSVKGIGELISANDSTEDITEQYFDRETRIEVLKIQLERLKSILVKTDNLADIIQLETEIARVTIQIEELTTELKRWDGLINYSTVNVTLNELTLKEGPSSASKTVFQRMGEGFKSTFNGVLVFAENFAVIFVSLLPALIPLGLIALIVIVLVKRSNKKRSMRLQGMNPGSDTQKQ